MMKKSKYTELVCEGFCKFYKEGKEELTCGAYNFLAEGFTPEDLASKIHAIKKEADFSCDEEIKKIICEHCEFLVDGCDFREGLDSPPCGGYAILEGLFSPPAKT